MSRTSAIRLHRVARGLSIRDLARHARMAPSTILRIERGEEKPRPRTAKRLLVALRRVDRSDNTDRLRAVLRDREPWESDPVSAYVVAAHPDGLETELIAEVMGLRPRTILDTEANALAKLKALANEDTARGAEVREWLATWAEHRAETPPRQPTTTKVVSEAVARSKPRKRGKRRKGGWRSKCSS